MISADSVQLFVWASSHRYVPPTRGDNVIEVIYMLLDYRRTKVLLSCTPNTHLSKMKKIGSNADFNRQHIAESARGTLVQQHCLPTHHQHPPDETARVQVVAGKTLVVDLTTSLMPKMKLHLWTCSRCGFTPAAPATHNAEVSQLWAV